MLRFRGFITVFREYQNRKSTGDENNASKFSMSNAGTMNGLSNENQYKTVNCNVFTPRNHSTLYFILHSEYTHYTTLKFLQLSSSSALFYRLIVRYYLQRAPDSFSSWLFYNVHCTIYVGLF